MNSALSGIRVLEIADEKGVYCGKLFADLGAEVIKIEPPGGSSIRRIPPFINKDIQSNNDHNNTDKPARSLFQCYMDTNKKSLTLDLHCKQDQEIFLGLCKGADLIIETLSPGSFAAFGFDLERLHSINPALVLTSITGFGQTGPRKDYKTCNIVAAAMGGAMVVTGFDADPPVMLAGSQALAMTSAMAAVSSMIALYHCQATGQGQQVDISAQEAMLAVSSICGVGKWLDDDIIPKRYGTGLFSSVPSGTYACKDGSIYLIINRPSHWLKLSKWINEVTGNQEVLDPMFHGPSSVRQPYRELLDLFIGELTRTFTVEQFYRQGQQRHLAVTPLSSANSIVADEHLNACDFYVPVEHPGNEVNRTDDKSLQFKYPGSPYRLSETPWNIVRCAPAVGQDNASLADLQKREVCKDKQSPPAKKITKGPLSHLRVVEFTAGMAGPWIGRFMAYCGADVIKVESKNYPDVTRHYVPPKQPELGIQTAMSPWFTDWNAGKRFVSLDLTKPDAVALAKDLIKESDVVIDNNGAKVLDKLGLGFKTLRALKPELILLSSTGYGKQGPNSSYISWGPNMETLSGLAGLSGFEHRECTMTQFAYPDPLSALHGLFAIMSSLFYQRATGVGQDIIMSQLEATIASFGHLLLEVTANDKQPDKLANASLYRVPQGCYPCLGEDRWCVISVADEMQWSQFCRVLGQSQWLDDKRFQSSSLRLQHRLELDEAISAWTQQRDAFDVMQLLQEAGIAAGVTQNTEDHMTRDPHLMARGFFEEIHHLVKGTATACGIPLGLSATPGKTGETGKDIGSDNKAVFCDLLGLCKETFEQYVIDGIIENKD